MKPNLSHNIHKHFNTKMGPMRLLTLASINFFLFFCTFTLHVQQISADGDHPWCYDDEKCSPAHWGGLCKTGHSQSPIDFQLDRIKTVNQLQNIKINHHYRQIQPSFFIKNNGHTIQVQLDEEMTSSLKIVSDGLKGAYQFSQLHFHWGENDQVGSEHTVSGASYSMEMHMVHFSDKYENILAAISDQNPRALAVFGVFFSAAKRDNPALNPITDAIEEVTSYHPDPYNVNRAGLNLSAFFPDILDLFRYDGSLTTPSCGEKVVWTVFRQPVPISHRQLAIFRSVQDAHGSRLLNNFRSPQPVSRRRVVEASVRLGEFQADDLNEVDTGSSAGGSSTSSKNIKGHGSDTHEHDDDDDDQSNEIDDHGKKNGAPSSNFKFSFLHLSITILSVCFANSLSTKS